MKKPRLIDYIFPVTSSIFVIVVSIFIYYFARGYRFNLTEREIEKTGVITVKSKPSSANLYINDDSVGRTPKSRTLDTGLHTISVWKEGYREWTKDVEIFEEKSTPLYPFLILEEIKKTSIWETDLPIVEQWEDQEKNSFIFLQQNSNEEYSLWTYRVNSPIWDLNPNPMEVITLDQQPESILISPNGELALLTLDDEETQTYLLELQKTNTQESLSPLSVSDLSNYKISWAKDNRHIVFESDVDIISIDTTTNTKYLLTKKEDDKKYIWGTDQEGFFYTLERLDTQEDSTYIYTLQQAELDGSDKRNTIDKIYLQKDSDEYIKHYQEGDSEYEPFTNSPESTQTMGEILSFEVKQDANGLYIKTDLCAYWYNIETEKYRMVTPHSADLIEFSKDSTKLLFGNGGNVYVFTIEKEEGDHTESLGSSKIPTLLTKDISNLHWLPNSTHISYAKSNQILISEKDGGNEEEIIPTENILLNTITNSLEYIVTLEKTEDNKYTINQYQIN